MRHPTRTSANQTKTISFLMTLPKVAIDPVPDKPAGQAVDEVRSLGYLGGDSLAAASVAANPVTEKIQENESTRGKARAATAASATAD